MVRWRMRLIVLSCGAGLILIGLSIATIVDVIHPMGPADFRVEWFAYGQLNEKFGIASQGRSIDVQSYTRDHHDSGGVYKIFYRHDERHGYLYCSYDPKSGDFNVIRFDQQ